MYGGLSMKFDLVLWKSIVILFLTEEVCKRWTLNLVSCIMG